MPLLTTFVLWLATYRLTRLVVADTFPPARAARRAVSRRFGSSSSWAYLVHCSWCAGFYVAGVLVAGLVAADRYEWADAPLPVPLLQVLAASAVAGLVALNLDVPPEPDEDEE